MIYLDYAANTPVCKESLDYFIDCEQKYPFNPNSGNPLAIPTRKALEDATAQIASIFQVSNKEVIYTSTATEANNLAIKGIARHYKNRGRHIITSYLEHSSVNGAISALMNEGFEVEYVSMDKNGHIDKDHLLELLRHDTIIVSICHVDSEIGLIQDVQSLGKLIKENSSSYFHVDGTQAIGKIPVSLEYIDAYSFAAHKVYGLNGCGGLVIKDGIIIEPQMHGGVSTTPYRSGTPSLGLIGAMSVALKLAVDNLKVRYEHVLTLNHFLVKRLAQYQDVIINSTTNSSPYILNLSFKTIKSETVVDYLATKDICLSTKSACCAPNTPSRPVMALTNNRKLALSTLRISLSHLTTMEELSQFLKEFDTIYVSLIEQHN